MGYVQVPVPVDHVLDVMRWVLFRTTQDEETRRDDEARVVALVTAADDETRALLVHVAAATIADEPLRLQDLALELGKDMAATHAAIADINARALDGRDLLEVRKEAAVGVKGKLGTRAFVGLRPDLAPLVRSTARASGGTGT